MNEIAQWVVLVPLGIVVLEMWIRLHSFLCLYEEESAEIRNRIDKLGGKMIRSRMIHWNESPDMGWVSRDLLPDHGSAVVWVERSGEFMTGRYDEKSNTFRNTYMTKHLVAFSEDVIRWGYIERIKPDE